MIAAVMLQAEMVLAQDWPTIEPALNQQHTNGFREIKTCRPCYSCLTVCALHTTFETKDGGVS